MALRLKSPEQLAQPKLTLTLKKPEEKSEPKGFVVSAIDPNYVVSDEEFIRRTRGSVYGTTKGIDSIAGTIHNNETKKLFWANGGMIYFNEYDTLAQAFDRLRQDKLASLRGTLAAEYKRARRLEGDYRTFVPGGYEAAQKIREQAIDKAVKRTKDIDWMSEVKKTG